MPSMYRHVHHQFVRNRLHNCTTIVPVTIYHQGSYVETYRRAKSQASIHCIDGEVQDAEPGAERACATALGIDRSARAGARWRQCRGAGNRTIAPNNLRRHRGDPHRHSEQNPQSARRNNVSGEQISRWFLLLSENLSASNYPGAANMRRDLTNEKRIVFMVGRKRSNGRTSLAHGSIGEVRWS